MNKKSLAEALTKLERDNVNEEFFQDLTDLIGLIREALELLERDLFFHEGQIRYITRMLADISQDNTEEYLREDVLAIAVDIGMLSKI